jgi:hypothetical protein
VSLDFVAVVLEAGNKSEVEIENRHTKCLYMHLGSADQECTHSQYKRSGSVDRADRNIPAYWNLPYAFRDILVQRGAGHKLLVVLAFLQSLGLDCGC